ncbi:hypothetical protein OSH11_12010 [Kaistia dalseonensis]|uniref:Transposase n=1 Tax=Kaistia dalseonensis TaxID=410840 RepID=A0ABU0H6T0_9HYPH|nr:hypothetical protein [Kaistia dalseonensis]MCX5495433.1 hypothetical protein [Kaistia dalseonensis]MDQ0438022.1 hypothetical protein [Kaistia dalseonensis]
MGDASSDEGRHAIAGYIGRMAGELRDLASNADLNFLAYLTAMLEEEALSTANHYAVAKRDATDRTPPSDARTRRTSSNGR